MPWFPRDQYLWDFWFTQKDDELHVFYLQASQRECNFDPEQRHNLAAVGHAILTENGWQEIGTAPAFAKSPNGSWDNISIWTGSVIQDPQSGLFYLFYTSRRKEDAPLWTPSEVQRPQQIGVATSRDLTAWERTPASLLAPVIPNPGVNENFDGVAWRDPFVIKAEDGFFYAFICARANPQYSPAAVTAGGIIAYVKSQNLQNWENTQPEILIRSDEFYQLEVPQVFWRKTAAGKRFYLLFCAQEKDCSEKRRAKFPTAECQTGTYYLHSELLPLDFQGIPKLSDTARLLAAGWYGGRLLQPETENNPQFFGFKWADADGNFVGGISDPMCTEFLADGSMRLCE